MKILVVGGAGYIGSHMRKALLSCGHEVTTFDNLSQAYRDAVIGGEFIEGDLGNHEQLEHLLAVNSFDAVMGRGA
jgi:UDP-glucose 4-epimerase